MFGVFITEPGSPVSVLILLLLYFSLVDFAGVRFQSLESGLNLIKAIKKCCRIWLNYRGFKNITNGDKSSLNERLCLYNTWKIESGINIFLFILGAGHNAIHHLLHLISNACPRFTF